MRRWDSRAFRLAAIFIGLMLLMSALAACGGGSDESTDTTGTAATPAKLRVLISSPAVYPFYEVYVAESMGFFEKRNLEVEILEVEGAEGTTTAFAAGQGDIMQGDVSTLNPSVLAQFKPIMFFNFMTSIFTIAVPADSPIQTPDQLDGLVVGVNSEQDPGMSLIKSVELKYDVTITPLITVEAAQALAGFDRDDIQAYATSLTGVARIEAAGTPMRSILPQEMVDASGGFGYWALRETMDAMPEAFKAYVEGLQEARAYIGDDPQKLVDWANSQTPIPAEELEFRKALSKAVISIRPKIEPMGYIDPAIWQLWWDTLLENGTITSEAGQPTDYYTNEFFDK